MRGFGELGPAKKSDPQSVTGMFWCRCEIEGTPDTLRHVAFFRSEGAFHVAIATLKLIGDCEEELTSRSHVCLPSGIITMEIHHFYG